MNEKIRYLMINNDWAGKKFRREPVADTQKRKTFPIVDHTRINWSIFFFLHNDLWLSAHLWVTNVTMLHDIIGNCVTIPCGVLISARFNFLWKCIGLVFPMQWSQINYKHDVGAMIISHARHTNRFVSLLRGMCKLRGGKFLKNLQGFNMFISRKSATNWKLGTRFTCVAIRFSA